MTKEGESLGPAVAWGMDARTRFDPKTDLRADFERFSPENLAANMPVVDVLRRFADEKNATPAQIALALASGAEAMDCSDPGYTQHRSPEREFGSNRCSADAFGSRELETAFSEIRVHGGRMSEKHMRDVDQTV